MAKKPSPLELAVENARRAKASVAAERARLDAEEADADAFLRLYEKFAPKDEVEAAKAEEEKAIPVSSPDAPFSTTPEIQQAAREYLRELKGPASIRMIYETITLRGIRIPGLKPMMNLSSKLSTSSDMQFTKDVGWWFKDEPVRAARDGGPLF